MRPSLGCGVHAAQVEIGVGGEGWGWRWAVVGTWARLGVQGTGGGPQGGCAQGVQGRAVSDSTCVPSL